MTLNGRIATTLVMLTIFAGMSVMALGYPAKARFLPLLVSIPSTVMCLAQLVLDVRTARQQRAGDGPVDRTELGREVKMFVWLAIFFGGILAFGFFYAGPIIVAAYLRFAERESWRTTVIAGVAAWLILYVVFDKLLSLYLFEGLLTPLLFG
jgi:Tripartite tricarboxylate transporter TctB family